MDTNIPALIPAPQAPQKPQAPPGTERPHHTVMFRPMHMTERHCHHLIKNHHRISGCFLHAETNQAVQSLHMAFAAYIVSIDTSGFALFFFMAQLTLHFNIFLQIFQRSFTDQTFFIHIFHRCFLSSLTTVSTSSVS